MGPADGQIEHATLLPPPTAPLADALVSPRTDKHHLGWDPQNGAGRVVGKLSRTSLSRRSSQFAEPSAEAGRAETTDRLASLGWRLVTFRA